MFQVASVPADPNNLRTLPAFPLPTLADCPCDCTDTSLMVMEFRLGDPVEEVQVNRAL